MLLLRSTLPLLSLFASLALADLNAHEEGGAHLHLERRASVADELHELSSLPSANRKQSSVNRVQAAQLAKVSSAVEAKVAQVASASAAADKASSSVAHAAVTLKAQVASAQESLASYTSEAGKSLSSASASLASAVSSYSAAEAQASANAASGCYPLSAITSPPGYDPASSVADCEAFCGEAYKFVALVEMDSPPATCYCPDIDSLAELSTSSAPGKCDAVYGSRDGLYVTIIKV